MMIDIRQIRYFVTLAETLHFGRAANQLNITQPPLSRQVASLEMELGVKLLERHSRKAVLTPAGRQFLADAKAVLASFEQACTNARLADEGRLGELSIGFMMSAAQSVLPKLTRRYVAAYPQVEVKLREVVPASLPEALLAGQFDAAITFSPGIIRGLSAYPIFRENLCLAVHRDHALARLEEVEGSALQGEPMIATPIGVAPSLRRAIDDYCRQHGFTPMIRLETQLQQTILSLVEENLGLALVPQSMGKYCPADVVFRPLASAPVIEQVILWRPENLNPTLQPFLALAGIPPQ